MYGRRKQARQSTATIHAHGIYNITVMLPSYTHMSTKKCFVCSNPWRLTEVTYMTCLNEKTFIYTQQYLHAAAHNIRLVWHISTYLKLLKNITDRQDSYMYPKLTLNEIYNLTWSERSAKSLGKIGIRITIQKQTKRSNSTTSI